MLKNTFRFFLILTALLQNAISFTFGGDNHSKNITDTSAIATVGAYKITLKEFCESYEFGPSFVKNFENPKMTHLQYMINEKLIALDGYANGINTIGSVSRMLKEVEDDIIVTEWYRQNIIPLAIVDSSLIKRGIEQSSVGLIFRYIFTDNEFDLQDIKTLLDNGYSFDSLYSLLKQDPKFFVDEVPTNFFTLFENNPQIADKLALLKPGTCSDIINTKDGFYLVLLDNAKKDFIITPIEYETMCTKVQKYYAKKILDSLTIVYIRGVMEECPPKISGGALKKLFDLLSKTNTQSQFINKGEKTININFNSEVILDGDPGSEILVSSKCDRFTVKDFVEWYSYRNLKINFSNQTASTLNLVKDVLFKMVRDRRLIKIARDEGYADDPDVKLEVEEWRDKLAYWKQKSIAIKQPTFTEEEVQRFYTENIIKYEVDIKDTPITYEQIKDKVKNELILYEYNKQLHNYLNSLEEKYPIRINEKLLNSIHLSDKNLSKKIDLFILKKGGTLPRQAFPTIDNEWRYY